MRQSPADRFFSTTHRAAVTATPRQMTAKEICNDLVIANLVATPLFVQEPAEVNHGVPVVPARSLGIAAANEHDRRGYKPRPDALHEFWHLTR